MIAYPPTSQQDGYGFLTVVVIALIACCAWWCVHARHGSRRLPSPFKRSQR